MMPQASTAPKLLRSGGLREFARLAAEATFVGVFASLVLLVAALFIATAEAAAPETPSTGTLLFKNRDATIPAPLLATDVRIDIAGIVARTRVTQRFVNPGEDWREGVYAFPLPESAAVDHLEMRIGERRIEGQIRERVQARKEYEQAKQEGKKSALVEQERPNLFTTSVASIGPNEEIVVQIEYQQTLRYDGGSLLDPLSDGDHTSLHSGYAKRARRHPAPAGRRISIASRTHRASRRPWSIRRTARSFRSRLP